MVGILTAGTSYSETARWFIYWVMRTFCLLSCFQKLLLGKNQSYSLFCDGGMICQFH
uniref:Uncharacterized protein n=1 Tax=Triticum urartu TaxID=4572 RepID=A0A8R7UT51_TRIUA